jgi:acetyl-CoA synthetase
VANVQASTQFLEARNQLLRAREDWACAQREFRWPVLSHFNWAHDYFDVIAADNPAPALRMVDDAGGDQTLSYSQLAKRSRQVAAFLAAAGVGPGDRILLMLPNGVPLWEAMLAAIRLGAVIVPATTLLERDELSDRLERGQVKAVITEANLSGRFAGLSGAPIRIAVGASVPGWTAYAASNDSPDSFTGPVTRADDLLLLYFTSGTTARPKLVVHTHASYPVGHLSTMYWLGIKPGDVHLNLSSPGWAKHAWSSFFAPWNAEATILAYHYERFDARALLDQLVRCRVTTFCAPPTVWRMLIQNDLSAWHVSLRELVSAGEPLNPEVIAQVRAAWGITIRDGFGQTETTAQVGNPPGQPLKPGSMGRPLPGYPVVLLNAAGQPAAEGEICLDLARRPLGLMQGYLEDTERTAASFAGGYYHTGDLASCDADGYLTYIGRTDDVFKSSDYRISPFELESVLIEHEAVAEAAVVPSPDPLRLSVPKAFIVLAPGCTADAATAASILQHVRDRVSPYKRIRRLEFAALPKTISGKIRRVELRQAEAQRRADEARRPNEFWEEDVHDLCPPPGLTHGASPR